MSLATPKLRQRAIGNPLSLLPRAGRRIRTSIFRTTCGGNEFRQECWPVAGSELAETISEQDFDRARPLWEVHIVSGLEDGRAAMIIKIHHAITDGVGGLQMAASLFDLTREPNTNLPPKPEAPEPHHADTMSRLEQGVQVEFASTFDDVKSSARGLGVSPRRQSRIRLPRLSTPKNGPRLPGDFLLLLPNRCRIYGPTDRCPSHSRSWKAHSTL